MKLKQLTRPLEIKSIDADGSFEGYGSVFNVVDSYREVVLPGAFTASIDFHLKNNSAPALLWQHRADEPIGKYTEFIEDSRGLYLKGELFINAHVPMADQAYTLLKRGGVKGLSIGFSVPEGGQEYCEKDDIWKLKQIDLWETSIVTFPANQEAKITEVRMSLPEEIITDIREFERFLRDAGLSRTQAKSLLSGGFDAVQKRDVDDGDQEAVLTLLKSLNTLRGVV